MAQFLHGVEIVEIDTGTRPIQTVRSSVIGVVGTAPEAEGATPAMAVIGNELMHTALMVSSTTAGAAGNGISVSVMKPEAATPAPVVKEKGSRVEVMLAMDDNGTVTSTAADIMQAVNSGSKLITVKPYGRSRGNGVFRAQKARLSGGASEPFPVNKPVLIAGSQLEAARLGSAGTLPQALTAIFGQAGAMVVVIRVEEGEDSAATISNVVGGVDDSGQYTGVHALLGAECAVHVAPKVLIAPGFTGEAAVATALQPIADRLRAIALIEGKDTTDADAISYRDTFGSKRLFLTDPGMMAWSTEENRDITVSNSAYIAGLIARIDNEHGFWWSPSNQLIYGITGLTRPIDFVLGDANSRANYLNENEVATVIHQDGYRLWGNRTCSADPKWAFINVVRTADILNDSLQREHLWAVDRCITRTYVTDVQEGVNAYIRSLIAQGALLGGRCWPDPDLNSPTNLAAGKVYWNFDFTPPAPAEHLTFQSILTDSYYAMIGEAA